MILTRKQAHGCLHELKSLLSYNSVNGWFRWRERIGGHECGSRAGRLEADGYRRIRYKDSQYYEHVLAFAFVYGKWPEQEIDHKNRIKDDNRFKNLRLSNRQLQMGNMGLTKNNTSGFKGVEKTKSGKYKARITCRGKNKTLGYFDDPNDAAKAYNDAAIEQFGDHACLN